MAHEDGRRGVEAFDEQSRLIPHRKAHRPQNSPHALAAQPGFGLLEKGGEHGWVIDGLEKPDMPRGVPVALLVKRIDLGSHAADGLSISTCQPEPDLRVSEE